MTTQTHAPTQSHRLPERNSRTLTTKVTRGVRWGLWVLLAVSFFCSEQAYCRAGGGRSFGSRGSRGFSSPSFRSSPSPRWGGSNPSSRSSGSSSFGTYTGQSQPRNETFQKPPLSSPARSSFLRNLGAGLAGGFLGSLLFRSLGYSHAPGVPGSFGGWGSGSGMGWLELALILGLIVLMFKLLAKKPLTEDSREGPWEDRFKPQWKSTPREESPLSTQDTSSDDPASRLMRAARPQGWSGSKSSSPQDPSSGFGATRQSALDREQALDLFFQIQGAWANRDLSSVQSLLENEVTRILNEDLYHLRALGQINRLENIAVRDVEFVESWKEDQHEFSTVRFTASLLDFTMDERTGAVVSGNKSTPVKFEELWTFTRSSSQGQWKLTAIEQT